MNLSAVHYLALSSLPEFRGELEEAVMIANWCVTQNDPEAEDRIVLQHPFQIVGELDRARKSAWELYEQLISELHNILDDYHQTQLGREHWEFITGWYIRFLCDIIVERISCIDSAANLHPTSVFLTGTSSELLVPRDAKEFLEWVRTDDYFNLYVTSSIIELTGRQQKKVAIDSNPVRKQTTTTVLDRLYQWLAGFFFSRNTSIVIYQTMFGRADLFMIMASIKKRMTLFMPTIEPNNSVILDKDFRTRGGSLGHSVPVSTVAKILMLKMLPSEYLEDYEPIDVSVCRYLQRGHPRVLVSGLGTFWSTEFAVLVARSVRRGAKYVGVQHGGTYGERELGTMESYERHQADEFVTWGYRLSSADVALPSPRVRKVRRSIGKVTGKILWVGTNDSRYIYQLGPRPIGYMFHDYFQMQERLYSIIPEKMRVHLVHRPYPTRFGHINEKWYEKHARLKVETASKPIAESIQESSLVLVDVMGSTTFIEALQWDVPVLCLGPTNLYEKSIIAIHVYATLKDAGVFHDTVESFQEQLEHLAENNILSWWTDPVRMEAVEFYKRYFSIQGDPVEEWSHYLMRHTVQG